jgi:2-polyprenyl-3-methyl-5-hydroxy-6-metoxy-1,4-benzoquinol methylase
MKRHHYIDENKKAYNEMAPFYKLRREKGDFEVYGDIREFSQMLEYSFKNPRILDIGPGAGVLSEYFSREGFETFAIDISEEMIKVAREESPQTRYLLGDFLTYDFRDLKFEGICAKAIIHLFNMEDARRFVTRCHSLIRDNGLFYLSLFVRNKNKEGFMVKNMCGKDFVRYNRHWTEMELESLLNDSPFKSVKTFSIPHGSMKKWSGILIK